MVSKENYPLFLLGWDKKNLSLTITVCHHSASLVMPIGDARDGFFYPTLTLIMDSYIHMLVIIIFQHHPDHTKGMMLWGEINVNVLRDLDEADKVC